MGHQQREGLEQTLGQSLWEHLLCRHPETRDNSFPTSMPPSPRHL